MNLRKFISLLSFSSILVFNSLFGQSNSNEYNFVSINEDITQSAITSIYKDSEGFIWITTYGDGIVKYNSVDFKSYNQGQNSDKKSLNSSIVFSIFQDSQKNIWVGTELGLNIYNNKLDKFENIDLDGKKQKFPIHAITEYDENTLLLGTHENGLFKLDKNTLKSKLIKYQETKPLKNLQINTIIKSSNGRFLIGTNHGLLTFDPYDEILQLAKFNTEKGYGTIEKSIESMVLGKDNSLWIGTSSSGLYKITNNDDLYLIEKFSITRKRILSIAEKTNGNILCGTENDGLFEIDYQTKKIINYQQDKLNVKGIKSNSIWSVFTDDKNRIWLGYYNQGIDVHDDNYKKFNTIQSSLNFTNSLNKNSVTSIVKDKKGRFWISMFDGGVDVYDSEEKVFVSLFDQKNGISKGLDRLAIPTIFIDSNNNVWVGTWESGLFLLKNNSNKFVNINMSSENSVFKSNRIMSFDEDSNGTIWIGSFLGGLYSYDPNKGIFKHHDSSEFKKYNIDTSNIRKVLVDHEDNVWLGTRAGLFIVESFSNNTFKVSSLNKEMNADFETNFNNPIIPSIVFSLFEDSKKNLWIGTLGDGLSKYNIEEKSFKRYDKNTGLIHETVFSITEDHNGAIWIGGNKGLTKLNTEKNTFIDFSKKDGLLSNSFNYNAVYKDLNNNVLYFGSSRGINYFNPDEISYNQEKPIVYLSNLRIYNDLIKPDEDQSPLKEVISKTKELVLNHSQRVFTIDYVGISYTRSENNQYAYFLEGYDNEWNYVETTRSATYKNIPAGDYTFMVKSSNNDGVWNNIPTTLKIKIQPAWWSTKIAITSYFIVLLLLGYFIYKFLITRIEEKRILQLERQEYKQFEALNAKKIQFFTNISHEFRTPLTLILTPLEDIIQNTKHKFPKEINEKHNIIFKNAKRLSRLINELMDFRKLQFNKMTINASQINIIPFIQEVVSHFEEEAFLKNIMLTVDYDQDDLMIWSDPSMLEKIIFNLLSNAFKATPIGGLITVHVNKSPVLIDLPLVNENKPIEALEIIIRDTGLGIKAENLTKVFDRFYQADEMNEQYYGGTGIGLELVKNFVNLHKGKIVLTSEENVGTQFKIYFPLGYQHFKVADINNEDKKVINQFSESQNKDIEEFDPLLEEEYSTKKIVLIVEDNAELRSYIKNELITEYSIKEAENGLEGLEKANKYMPDIIITDVMMPIMDGFELCSRVKSDLKTSHIPILMVTAKGMQIDKVKGIDSGADVYLNKPFNMRVLKSHLNQLITSRQVLFDKYFNSVSTTINSDHTTSLDKEFMNNVLNYINENINDEKLNVENLAGELLLSRSKLYRKIKALTGDTANEFIRKIRLEKAKQIIETTEYTISEVCYKVGFSSPSYFTKCFKDYFEFLPTELRDNLK